MTDIKDPNFEFHNQILNLAKEYLWKDSETGYNETILEYTFTTVHITQQKRSEKGIHSSIWIPKRDFFIRFSIVK